MSHQPDDASAGFRRAPRARILPTLRGYQPAWLSADIVAGLTLVAIAVPEQMATARLANMPAIAGLYAFVAGSVMIAALGASAQMSVGADSTIAPVFAAGVATLAAAGSPQYMQLVGVLALLVGALLLAVGLLRLGWVADFISTPVVSGILAGIAIEIFVRQIPSVLGLAGGGVSTLQRLARISHQVGQTNGWALAIAVVVLAIILVSERLDRRIPGALVGLAVSILAVHVLGLRSHGVHVLGAIPAGLPALGLPHVPLRQATHLVVTALTVGFVCVVQTAATARSLGSESGATELLEQDLVGLGAGNLIAALASAFPVNSSPPRSAVVAASGGRSQVASLVAVLATLLVVFAATGLLADLPQATLGAILVFVASRLLHVKDLRAIRRFSGVEFGLALLTVAAVAVFGIEQGVVAAFILSLADRTRLAARPKDAILGREAGTDHWIPATGGRPTEQEPGTLVYLLLAPLWFGNAQRVTERIRHLVAAAPEPVARLIIDAAGVADIDFTGARALHTLVNELHRQGVAVGIARASGLVPRDLARSDLLGDIGREYVYADVESAVRGLHARSKGGAGP